VEALSSITATVNQQQMANLVLLYLSKHGRHADSISLKGFDCGADRLPRVSLPTFPATLGSLSSLALDSVVLWQPGSGYRCVLGAAVPPLRQLRLNSCRLALQDGGKGLAAALALLPGLEHLSISNSAKVAGCHLQLSGIKLRKLQQLTYLHLQQRTGLLLRPHVESQSSAR
jgi:hypothetical protein